MMNRTKEHLWYKYENLLHCEHVDMTYLFNYFSYDELEKLYEFIKEEKWNGA